MLFFQILLVIFFLFALVKVWARFKAKDLTLEKALVWSLLWIAAGVVVVWPNSTAFFAKRFGLGRGADLVVYSALAVLFFILFRLLVTVERLKREITTLTREIALKNGDKK